MIVYNCGGDYYIVAESKTRHSFKYITQIGMITFVYTSTIPTEGRKIVDIIPLSAAKEILKVVFNRDIETIMFNTVLEILS